MRYQQYLTNGKLLAVALLQDTTTTTNNSDSPLAATHSQPWKIYECDTLFTKQKYFCVDTSQNVELIMKLLYPSLRVVPLFQYVNDSYPSMDEKPITHGG